ncbi:hypothetical protein IV500_11985 [Paeniglutamicibacter antarcticus]|uniref:Uncharacterized protein n=1 Tax=Arthrobacter terrae TaxID=2935737 RepID=A0A931CSI8_9MICC|nr:hypothetical protein [Arthrobacter terrae]MBG0740101.1 hypothetical protein [Arthrobacter terrae]
MYAAAWKQAFDGLLDQDGVLRGRDFAQFDSEAVYQRYVDGEPAAHGLPNFLAGNFGLVIGFQSSQRCKLAPID